MTQTTNLSLGNEPTGVAFPSDPYSSRFIFDNLPAYLSQIFFSKT